MYVLYVSQKSSFNVKLSVTAILRDEFGINDLENNYLSVVKILRIFGIKGKIHELSTHYRKRILYWC